MPLNRRQLLQAATSAAAAGLVAGGATLFARTSVARPAQALRPPGALDEERFLGACIRCGLCVRDCPPKNLRLADWAGGPNAGVAVGTPYFEARSIPCEMCEDIPCVKACPRMLIAPGEGGYPEVSFAKQGCNECGECEAACKPKALDRGDARPAWRWKAVIDGRCLAVRRVECRVCAEICDVRAIRMVPEPGGVALAEVSPHQCTGCGECVAPCPTGAIRMVDPADRVAPG